MPTSLTKKLGPLFTKPSQQNWYQRLLLEKLARQSNKPIKLIEVSRFRDLFITKPFNSSLVRKVINKQKLTTRTPVVPSREGNSTIWKVAKVFLIVCSIALVVYFAGAYMFHVPKAVSIL